MCTDCGAHTLVGGCGLLLLLLLLLPAE